MEDYKDQTPGTESKKKFYALNLTEGRIIIIFVSFVILVVVGIFATLIIMANLSRVNKDQLTEETENASDYNYYNNFGVKDTASSVDLSGDVKNTGMDKEVIVISDASSDPLKSAQNDAATIPQLDNSEVIYSSTAKTETKTAVTETVKKTTTTTVKKTAQTATQKSAATTTAKSKSTKYVVQVGSYTSKKSVDTIADYYTKAGYPVFIRETTTGGKTYYRLRVGPFREKSNADKYLASLKVSKYGKNSYISEVYNL